MILDQIADSFIRLLKSKPCTKITVQMICDGTPTSRNTFYYNIESKEKLVEWICCRDFMKYCFPYFKLKTEDIGCKSFFSYIQEKRDFYTSIYQADGGQLLQHCLVAAYSQSSSKENIREYAHLIPNNQHKVDVRIYRAYSHYGIAAIVLFWIGQGMKIPIEDMARDLAIMLTKSLEEVRDNFLY